MQVSQVMQLLLQVHTELEQIVVLLQQVLQSHLTLVVLEHLVEA